MLLQKVKTGNGGMKMTMGVLSLLLVAATSLLAGFTVGRYSRLTERAEAGQEYEGGREGDGFGERAAETEAGFGGHRTVKKESGRNEHGRNGQERIRREKRIPLGWAIGSPVSGAVSFLQEGSQREAVIVPEQGMVFAPAAGKITKLFPTGNGFRLRTDFGVELLVLLGKGTGELEGLYFRPRVVQNEIVEKGKPLIEFDLDKIQEEGYDTSVSLSVEEAENFRNISVTDVQRVKTGENLLWVNR